MRILGIDPGTEESGYCWLLGGGVGAAGVLPNREMLSHLAAVRPPAAVVIEMIASYGMPVGMETFETCVWIGRFMQAADPLPVHRVLRREVKLELCGSLRARDANIRQALKDLYGPVGAKAAPGPLYGVKSHAWQALAVATAFRNRRDR